MYTYSTYVASYISSIQNKDQEQYMPRIDLWGGDSMTKQGNRYI